MKIITLQPSPRTDHITEDGTELTQLPYPFHVTETGDVLRQDFWQGDPAVVIGFQDRVDVQQVDLWWQDVVDDPQRAIGKYAITMDTVGNYSTRVIAIASVDVTEQPEEETDGDASPPR
jgi:hypothetical protein